MLNNDLLQVKNTPNQAIKPTDNESKQSEEGGCNKEKFEDSLEKAFKAFSTNSDE
ncbi:MAG: serum response factor-binding protein [Rhodobacteraceae bacterium]|nr:serum response factor-binding protein [Paracoccaceae bacterium]